MIIYQHLFKKLKSEAEFFLSSLHNENDKIWYDVVDPNRGSLSQINALGRLLSEKGINPTNIRVTTSDGVKENRVYPFIHLEKGESELFINILEDRDVNETEEDAIYRSIQKIESKVTKGIYELSKSQMPKIGLVASDKYLKRNSYELNNFLSNEYESEIVRPIDLYRQRDSIEVAIIPISSETSILKRGFNIHRSIRIEWWKDCLVCGRIQSKFR